jgi:hypothetical protein
MEKYTREFNIVNLDSKAAPLEIPDDYFKKKEYINPF